MVLLCFGFVLKANVSITAEQSSRGLFCSSSHQWGGWRGTRSWEGTQQGQMTPTEPRDIPDHLGSHSVYKAGGEGRRYIQSGGGCLPRQGDGSWLSQGWLNLCLPMGSGGWISFLVHAVFALPIKLLLTQPTNLLTFTLLLLSPIPHEGMSWLSGLNHNTLKQAISRNGGFEWNSNTSVHCVCSNSGSDFSPLHILLGMEP